MILDQFWNGKCYDYNSDHTDNRTIGNNNKNKNYFLVHFEFGQSLLCFCFPLLSRSVKKELFLFAWEMRKLHLDLETRLTARSILFYFLYQKSQHGISFQIKVSGLFLIFTLFLKESKQREHESMKEVGNRILQLQHCHVTSCFLLRGLFFYQVPKPALRR